MKKLSLNISRKNLEIIGVLCLILSISFFFFSVKTFSQSSSDLGLHKIFSLDSKSYSPNLSKLTINLTSDKAVQLMLVEMNRKEDLLIRSTNDFQFEKTLLAGDSWELYVINSASTFFNINASVTNYLYQYISFFFLLLLFLILLLLLKNFQNAIISLELDQKKSIFSISFYFD